MMNDVSYRVRDGYPKHNCAEEWAKHRKLTRIVWGLFAGWIPYGFFVITSLNWLHLGINLAFVAIIPYILALLIISNLASNFRCPRCGSRFYAWGPWGLGHNGFARKCRNCGLPKWQCGGLDQAQLNRASPTVTDLSSR
jgi:hypothetical protein